MAATRTKTKSARSSRPSTRRGNGTIRTYRAAMEFLGSVTDYERQRATPRYDHTNYNLSRMNRLLAGLGNPHKKIRSAHIAGTKGKGSTATMLSAMLQNCGYAVGLYTSPHIVDLRERIVVDGKMIAEAELTRIMAKIAPVVKRLKDSPTFFEIMTAAAFLHFVRKGVDIAVVETGLGGRLDSTNVLRPEVCGITSISFDHESQLGRNLGKIAEEKAGIFKSGIPVVSAPQEPEVHRALKRVAGRQRSPLAFAGEEIEFSYRFENSRATGPHTRVCLSTDTSRFEHLLVPLMGEHQAINCGVALGLLDRLKSRGFDIDDEEAATGLARVVLPGRMEQLRDEPRIIADGAHNPSSLAALIRAIGQNISYDSMVVIFGCAADKNTDQLLDRLALGADKVIFTRIPSPRSADPHDLATSYRERTGKMAQVAEGLREALDIADRAVGREDLICITGSFYLVGQSKRLLQV